MPADRKTSAFTLIELMVVLAIAGLIMALVPPMLSNVIPGTQVKSAARHLAAGLKLTRDKAITSREETVLTLDMEHNTYAIADTEKQLDLPDDTVLTLTTAETEMLTETRGSIRFFADGSSTGGQIRLAYRQSEYLVDVNWLTGQVSILQ
jgi:general secretion pathway protein H